jgi:hypothetical protein
VDNITGYAQPLDWKVVFHVKHFTPSEIQGHSGGKGNVIRSLDRDSLGYVNPGFFITMTVFDRAK